MIEGNKNLLSIENIEAVPLTLPEFTGRKLHVEVLRLDNIHPVISGNKWFKLKYYLGDALTKQADTIITFGGAWSNHIIATAYAAKVFGLKSVGVIRGEKPGRLSQTLQDASGYGMTLEFISRSDYALKNDDSMRRVFEEKFGNMFLIPEGGAGVLGIKGSKEILSQVELEKYSHIMCAIGTGTMFTGIVNSSLASQQIIGINVLKGMNFIPEQFIEHPSKASNCKIFDNYHFGGYAKKTAGLIGFMNDFYKTTGIPTDFVYTGKLVFALFDLINLNFFPAGSKVLVIHSGGLQGNLSLPSKTLLF
jgi:1-aminocyclopropane-1-carboxylate deaminase